MWSPGNTGLRGDNAIAYQIGQKIGDAGAVATGVIEDGAAGVGEFFSAGAATPVAVPLAIHGTVTAGFGLKNLLTPVKNIEATPSNTKANGKYTEPKLPSKTVAEEGNIKAEHYTRSGDHGPPHIHIKGGGKETKVGQNGKPISGAPELTAAQQEFCQ